MLFPPAPPPLLADRVTCPTDITQVSPMLLRDLPSYANRVIIRARSLSQFKTLPSVLLAGNAEYEPLPVVAEQSLADPNLQQFFFTTLVRQRVGDQIWNLQQYHWLLLVPTPAGLRVTLSYTRTGHYPQMTQPLTPPRETSQGAIAQAVQLWLRDCQAGVIRPT